MIRIALFDQYICAYLQRLGHHLSKIRSETSHGSHGDNSFVIRLLHQGEGSQKLEYLLLVISNHLVQIVAQLFKGVFQLLVL